MKTQADKPRQTKQTGKENVNARPSVKVDDMEPAKDAKGGRTTVKDSHDRYANTSVK